MKDPFFYKFNCKTNPEELLAYEEKNRHQYFSVSGFEMFLIPKELIKDHPLMDVVEKFNGAPYLLKLEPWTFLDFHVDTNRTCTINSLLTGFDSHTYFTYDKHNLLRFNIIPLHYTLGSCYLFNTKQWHGVANHTERRVNLSISFASNAYREILEYCQQKNL